MVDDAHPAPFRPAALGSVQGYRRLRGRGGLLFLDDGDAVPDDRSCTDGHEVPGEHPLRRGRMLGLKHAHPHPDLGGAGVARGLDAEEIRLSDAGVPRRFVNSHPGVLGKILY